MYRLFARSYLFVVAMLLQTVYLQGNRTCVDSIFMKIHYTTKLINTYVTEHVGVSSANECLELCRNNNSCKSVGIETSLMACYLYNGRVYAGLPGTVMSNIIYYWLLEPKCPVGYDEDPTSKICTKYFTITGPWLDGQSQCELDGGHLFIVDSVESLDVLINIAGSGAYYRHWRLYLGATDEHDEGEWNWLNGIPVDRTEVSLSDYNNDTNCLSYYASSGLEDSGCSNSRFICQIPTIQTYLPAQKLDEIIYP